MKMFKSRMLSLALLAGLLIVVLQVEAQGRRSGSRRTAVAEQDDAGLDEQPQPARRRSSSRRTYADEEADESSDDSSAVDEYQPRSRSSSRRRYQDQDADSERPARRRSRKNSRRGNNNNVNFNGLPDGFPSAAFGAGFGAAVSSGGRGRGPSNAAGFGAGFAQSGGGNALAGGFGSGLVNGGGRNYDDDDDSDYDSGRDNAKSNINCMMLQLVQSPSQRVQRLIRENCSIDGETYKTDAKVDKTQKDRTSRPGQKSDTTGGDGGGESADQLDLVEYPRSRGARSSSSVLSSTDESPDGDGSTVTRVGSVNDRGSGRIAASASSFTSRTSDDGTSDDDSDDGTDDGRQ